MMEVLYDVWYHYWSSNDRILQMRMVVIVGHWCYLEPMSLNLTHDEIDSDDLV